MRIDIRDSHAEDLPAIVEIYGLEVREGRASFELEPPDIDEMTRRRDALVKGNYPYLVAVDADGAIAGYAYAGPYRARPAYRGTVENSVYVARSHRRLGVAARLLEALVAASAKAGFRQMIAVIGDSANAGSIGLHTRAGFAHVGVLRSVGWKHGTWLDTVLMQRPLGDGDEAPPAGASDASRG